MKFGPQGMLPKVREAIQKKKHLSFGEMSKGGGGFNRNPKVCMCVGIVCVCVFECVIACVFVQCSGYVGFVLHAV